MPKAITITGPAGKPGSVYYNLAVTNPTTPTPTGTQLLLRMSAAALNHRDLFIRQHLYPGTAFDVPLLADGSGVVISTGPDADKTWQGKRVIVNPGEGWKDDPAGPEDAGGYRILGGTKTLANGTLQEVMVVEQSEVEAAPAHLSAVEAAALPLTGLTAWRAVMTKVGKGNLGPGKNLLITGIGGGVALMALTFAVAAGTGVWVTSGDQAKIEKAKALGAKGGVIYKEDGWDKKLLGMLGETKSGARFDAIVDGAGGDVADKGAKLLKLGGVVVSYGMTLGPKISFSMQAVLKNIEVKGSTMGSRKEFTDMVNFVKETKAKPVVSRVVQGIDNMDGINGLFEDMKAGKQFGKLVIEISKEMGDSKL